MKQPHEVAGDFFCWYEPAARERDSTLPVTAILDYETWQNLDDYDSYGAMHKAYTTHEAAISALEEATNG